MRGTDLDVDSESPCDFEPRFFCPRHDEISGLEALGAWRPHWRPTRDDPETRREPEWIRLAGDTYARLKSRWFQYILSDLAHEYEGEVHPVYVVSLPLPSPSPHLH